MSASTQNQALAALLFPYRVLLERDVELDGVARARTKQRLPVVFSVEDVRAVLRRLSGAESLVAGLLYGSGLRLLEALRLLVHDLDFGRHELIVRSGKGDMDRRALLPATQIDALRQHLNGVRQIHRADLAAGWGRFYYPMPWPGSIPMLQWNGAGNGSSPSTSVGAIQPQARKVAITWTPH